MAAPPFSPDAIIDDKSPHCIPFILSRLSVHQAANPSGPFFIGLNGVQGAGKTTLVSALAHTLQEEKGLETLVCSIDDLYLTHEDQLALAREHASNPLVQHRGEPGMCLFSLVDRDMTRLILAVLGTHDMHLARDLFSALEQGRETKVPMYDKSAYNGQGDRVPSSLWKSVNAPGQPRIQVVIFEGWCVGFRAIGCKEIEAKQAAPSTTLHKHRFEDLVFVNEKLKDYDVMTDAFDAFIHIDAQETGFVYDWRLEQEAALRREKGSGMTDEMVRRFVDGYYPAYELYTDGVRAGVLKEKGPGRQLRLVVGRDRRVRDVITT
jgi:D-glycerate 3-kinase